MTTMQIERMPGVTDRVKIDSIPGGILYRAEVILPDGSVKVIEDLRSFTTMVRLNEGGKIDLRIQTGKSGKENSALIRKVPYPYHYLDGPVLCAVKFNQVKVIESFALNYCLFCKLEWKTCLMFHVEEVDGEREPAVFVSDKAEWERHGVVGRLGRDEELNISLDVAKAIHNPEKIVYPAYKEGIQEWLDHSVAKAKDKGKL